MKKIFVITMLLLFTLQVQALTANEYWAKRAYLGAQNRDLDPLYELFGDVDGILGSSGELSTARILFTEETGDPTATEGTLYYNATSQVLRYRKDGSWANLAAESGTVSLDVAYNNGNGIDVDGSAVTLTVSNTDDNVALIIVQNDVTNNNDGMTVTQSGSGDGISIEPQEADSGGLKVVAVASGTVPLVILDGSTNNIDLANDKGQLLIQCDDPYINAGATALMILDSSTPITASEGFLARFVHSGTAVTNGYAVEIEVPATQPALAINSGVAITGQGSSNHVAFAVTGNDGTNNTVAFNLHNEGTSAAMVITPDDTDTPALLVTGIANSSVTVVTIDGDTGDWIGGADDVAMVEIIGGATANADAGGGLFAVISGTTPAANSEGYLCRFISTGTATTTAHAVEIETTNTQPALMLNNQLTITGVDSTGVLVAITGNDDTGDTDVMTIANGAASDGIQITNSDVGSTAIRAIATASQTTSTIVIDGATNNWDGADNVGMLHLTHDDAAIDGGATLLMCLNSGTMKAAAEGYLARFVQVTGAAVTDAYAVEIETTATSPCLKLNGQMSIAGQGATDGVLLDIVSADTDDDTVQLTGVGSGDVLQITANATTSVGINAIAKAAATVSLAKFDAATNNVNMADDVGLVHLSNDTALAHTGATLLYVRNTTGAPIASAEGFLARFVDSGTADTSSYAVEIETANTTPCLHLNNELVITGADSAGTLLTITGSDVTGDTDTLVMTHRGDASAVKITTSEPAGTGIEVVCDAAQTSSAVKIDGSTGAAWLGASNVGMLHLQSDGGLASVNSSLLYIANSGVPVDDSRGSSLRIVDTGNASAGTAGYAVYISATDATVEAMYIDDGEVLIDEILTTGIGYQSTVVTKVAHTNGAAGSTIAPGTRVVHVTGFNADSDDWILLPAGTIGQRLTIISDVAHEIRTPAASNDTINDVDADGGAAEYAVVLDDINDFVCTGTGASWIAVAHDKLGAAKTIAPD